MSYPLGRHGRLIGFPHQGTHNLGNWQSDNAYDISVPVGTPVYAVADGVIGSNIGSLGAAPGSRFAGLRVQLNGSGNSWWYGHLSRLAVHAGQHVKEGDLIGFSGSANGVAHLHIGQMKGDLKGLLSGGAAQVSLTGGPGDLAKIAAFGAGPLGAVAAGADEITGGAVSSVAREIVGAVAGALGQEGARILLWIAFVFGGAGLAVTGIGRLSGLKPTDLAMQAAKARAGAK